MTINPEQAGHLAMFSSLLITLIGLPAQILKNYWRQSTKGLSLLLMASACWSYCVWALYGFIGHNDFILYAQAPGFFLGLILIGQIFWYRDSTKQKCDCDCHG